MIKKIVAFWVLSIFTATLYGGCKHCPPPNSIRYIVWDVGSTLTIVSRWGIAQEMGARDLLGMIWHIGKRSSIEKTLFDVLENYGGKQKAPSTKELLTRDTSNAPLPHFMSDTWLCSRISNKELIQQISHAVDRWKPKRPVSDVERKIIKKVLCTALSAETIGKHTRCSRDAIELVKQCHKQGYTQFILSNFEKEAFEQTCANKKNKRLLKYIPRDRIVISGECGMIKPYDCIYRHFLEKYNLNPAECLLIDDRWENVKAARNNGMYAIRLKEGNYKKLAKKLDKWGIIHEY